MSCHELNEQNETNDDKVDDYEEESGEADYVAEEFRQFENWHKPNLEKTETVNLGDSECVKEVKISTYLNGTQKEILVHLLAEYSDVFIWEVGDMQGLSTDVVSHKLPINPGFEPMKQKTRKFKPELSLKIRGGNHQADRVSIGGSNAIPNLVGQCRSGRQERWKNQDLR